MKLKIRAIHPFYKRISVFASIVGAVFLSLGLSIFVFAAGEEDVDGTFYEFDKDSEYEFSESKEGKKIDKSISTVGAFSIKGDIVDILEKNGVPAYAVGDRSLQFLYTYDDSLLKAEEENWHLVNDNDKKVDKIKLDSKIKKGVLILQTSKDRKNWVNAYVKTNMLEEQSEQKEKFYDTTDVQLVDGCYYRLIVAYRLGMRTKENQVLFVNLDKYDYKECAEVYEFYAYNNAAALQETVSVSTYSLGSKVRVKQYEGYFGKDEIKKGDPHYGWDIGKFFVSGYTDDRIDTEGNPVFLKNPGDKITLWFNLEQDITCLDGKENLSISADSDGNDQYFETKATDFGHGALIIRYIDYNNVKHEPEIYTNYLQANASVGADTKVQLFEEGDYEVALDYEIKDDQLIDKFAHYRIFFKFAVRNGNCMVYPFDVDTGSELTNNSVTSNGFYLDLAKSRYLEPIVKKENLVEGADGLTEDVRYNRPAEDGEEYTEEGIYTITVQNKYTNQTTTKKIYVGTDKVMKAYMVSGLPIADIKAHIEQGGEIDDDGNIILLENEMVEESVEESTDTGNEKAEVSEKEEGTSVSSAIIYAIVVVVILVSVGIFATGKMRKKSKEQEDKL